MPFYPSFSAGIHPALQDFVAFISQLQATILVYVARVGKDLVKKREKLSKNHLFSPHS
jgi:hypothetical protein